MLLLCNLVRVDTTIDGSKKICVLSSEWARLFRGYGLLGDTKHEGIVSKLYRVKLYSDALERSNKLDPPAHQKRNNMTTHMHFFRMGCVSDGAPIPIGQEEINQCLEPPRLNRWKYSAVLDLSHALERLIFDFQINEEK